MSFDTITFNFAAIQGTADDIGHEVGAHERIADDLKQQIAVVNSPDNLEGDRQVAFNEAASKYQQQLTELHQAGQAYKAALVQAAADMKVSDARQASEFASRLA
ncbi:MAG: hypothetical protein HOQ24_17615 [Mycobacteriaceae bacterium]|nr:hypothetical protein [Mycobacteriaceae bacterium]